MQELQSRSFLGAVTELRALIVICQNYSNKSSVITDPDKNNVLIPHLRRLIIEMEPLNVKIALASANRFLIDLEDSNLNVKYSDMQLKLADIESRFIDHFDSCKLLFLNDQEVSLLHPADQLLIFNGAPVSKIFENFPRSAFEIEESAKCIAFGRYTASVFHTMRLLENAIKALSKFLDIPDPVKMSDRNWGQMLQQIHAKIDEKWPKKGRLPQSDGAEIEALYATLDAVRNPWRNATMHVEHVYAPHEALHIARCAGFFLLKLMEFCDEDGLPISPL